VPPPDPAEWADAKKPAERLRAALLAFYRYYRRAEEMLTRVYRDRPELPALDAVLAPWDEFLGAVRDDLLEAWTAPEPARVRLAAAIAHALRFETWRSLGRVEGLGDAAAAELMVALAETAARPTD
jgi:AcrR family transcriptional regulator